MHFPLKESRVNSALMLLKVKSLKKCIIAFPSVFLQFLRRTAYTLQYVQSPLQ